MTCNSNFFEKKSSIPYTLYQSELGRYFIGKTLQLNPTLPSTHSIAALVNPTTSVRNIYVNVITVLNPSLAIVTADFYLKSTLPSGTSISTLVSCTNLTLNPQPNPYGQVQFLASASNTPPTGGVSIFSRIVTPYSTEIVDGGQIIIPPGQSLIVYLSGLAHNSKIVVAFGWWEESPYNCNSHYCEYPC